MIKGCGGGGRRAAGYPKFRPARCCGEGPANPWPAAAILSNFYIEAVRESLFNNFAHDFSYFRH